ncbi:cbb3-type cytochrome oxidase assembly protein CcoS [Chitinimonas sp. BJYL2]|uniref:cbb3-type cytochrome oxidase assembly protein CcoS n=1 Tax=Chitinimonas sp. BJYL2 TaxID=2976696 RepID=UPI0022B43CDA|nr:cbb3-type cytochrome oxidase assembly protein CcoS [Chitinimonas sp. BJYL2]
MESLYLLIPLSVLLVLLIVGLFGWAIHSGQLDNLEREGNRILEDETEGRDILPQIDGDQDSDKH